LNTIRTSRCEEIKDKLGVQKALTDNSRSVEEIRGLYVLGLLAVLASIRVQQSTMNIIIGTNEFSVLPFLDITILLWSLYAFFMVLGFSEDIIGKRFSSAMKETARLYLILSFIMLALLSIMLAIFAYGIRLLWESVLLIAVGIGLLVSKATKIPSFRIPSKINFRNIGKKIAFLALSAIVVICFMFILTVEGQTNQMLLTLIGSVTAITLFILRRKWKGVFNDSKS
jgi:hypothetical protein